MKWHFVNAAIVGCALLVALALSELLLRWMGYSFPLYPETIEFGWPTRYERESFYKADPDLLWVPKDYSARLEQAKHAGVVFMVDSCTEFGSYDTYLRSDAGGAGIRVMTMPNLPSFSAFPGLIKLSHARIVAKA